MKKIMAAILGKKNPNEPKGKYVFAHPESVLGTYYDPGYGKIDGHPDWVLIGFNPNGLLLLRRKNWLEKLLRL